VREKLCTRAADSAALGGRSTSTLVGSKFVRLSDLFAQLDSEGDVMSFTAYLAAADKDGKDVDLASVGRVEVDYEQGVARIYPASTATDPDSVEPEPYLGMVLSQLPMDAAGDNDLRLLVEVPVLRDDATDERPSLVDLAGIHIGHKSEEVWLLVQPPGDFAAGLLPT
jgi:hypothetical protein